MSDSQLYTAEAVVEQLHVSPDQLRRWTKEFAAQLSASAVGSGYYRYGAADIRRLQLIRDLSAQGQSLEEVTSQLTPSVSDEHNPDRDNHHEPAQPRVTSNDATVVIHSDDTAGQGPAAMVLREVLTGFAAGQEAILNSQQANRNLMGVVIQDNFNLKEENAHLRERMMKLEQELNELRRSQSEQRQQLELRLRQLEQKKDWFGRLLGF